MAQAMMQAVGINARIEVLEWATQLDRYNTGKYQISSFTFSSRIDPALSFEQFSGDKTAQPRKVWDDPQAQKLIDESFLESDPARRQVLFDQLHALMLEQTPLLVLYNGADAWATGKRVQGFSVWEGKPRAWGIDQALTRGAAAAGVAGCPASLTPGVARFRRKAMARAVAASSSAAIASPARPRAGAGAEASSNSPPTMPPPAMATFQTVARIDCATSPGAGRLGEAVCSRVGEPPNATPQAATAT